MIRRRLLGGERQLQMTDDPVHDGILCEESYDLHPPAASWAEERLHFIDLPDHLGPTLGGDASWLILHHPQSQGDRARLPDLPPMGVGVEPILC